MVCLTQMANPELESYIKTARSAGVSDEAIKANLLQAGWSERDVSLVLNNAAQANVPVPPAAHPGMWITFQYLLLFITLYVTAVSLGGLLYYWSDKLIPDAASSIYDYVGSYLLQGYLSALIVAFPIFAILFIVLKKNLIAHPAIKGIRARQTLFYITLVITFIIIMSYIISIVYGLLSGDVTGRAVAHFLITLIIAGPIFGYLLKEVRSDRTVS